MKRKLSALILAVILFTGFLNCAMADNFCNKAIISESDKSDILNRNTEGYATLTLEVDMENWIIDYMDITIGDYLVASLGTQSSSFDYEIKIPYNVAEQNAFFDGERWCIKGCINGTEHDVYSPNAKSFDLPFTYIWRPNDLWPVPDKAPLGTPAPQCVEHIWGEKSYTGNGVFQPFPGYETAAHYALFAEYTQTCSVCGFTETALDIFTPETSPVVACHLFTQQNEYGTDTCELCGEPRSITDEKEEYLNMLAFLLKTGRDPMDIGVSVLPQIIRKRLQSSGVNVGDTDTIINILRNADPIYRDIYLLSFYDYNIQNDECDGTPEFKMADNTLHMKNLTSAMDFADVFLHESGHAVQESQQKKSLSDDQTFLSHPLHSTMAKIEYCLEQDIREKIIDTVKNLSKETFLDELEDLRQRLKSADPQRDGLEIALDFLGYMSRNSEILSTLDPNDDSLIAFFANTGNLTPSSYKTSSEWQTSVLSIIDETEELILRHTGINLDADFSVGQNDEFAASIADLFTKNHNYQTWTVSSSNAPSEAKKDKETLNYYNMVRYKLSNEIYTNTVSGIPNQHGSNMVVDLYSGVTNMKIRGSSLLHEGEENLLFKYWYNPNQSTTHNQCYEAWAEFFSARIRNDKANLRSDAIYLESTTVMLEQFAKELRDYYMEKYVN